MVKCRIFFPNYTFTQDWLCVYPIFLHFAESLEGREAALKAFQSLDPGDFPGFLKLLRKPSSQRLQSCCTAFLNTIDAYHVNLSPRLLFPTCALHRILQKTCSCSYKVLSLLFQDLPVQKQSDLVQDFYQNISAHFNGEFSKLSAGNKLINVSWSKLLLGLSVFGDSHICHLYRAGLLCIHRLCGTLNDK